MTLAQLGALIDAENEMHEPAQSRVEHGSGEDLVALASLAGR